MVKFKTNSKSVQKISLTLLLYFIINSIYCQESAQQFWNQLQSHCGKSYEGKIIEAPKNDDFRGKKLVMKVISCNENEIKIPFFVGDDFSRTWILTFNKGRITLKHDHRHKNGSEDKITQYGGTSTNYGSTEIQMFPADQETATLIPYASQNVWWLTLTDRFFTYNLRRMGSDRLFTVSFDLTNEIEVDWIPWGWND